MKIRIIFPHLGVFCTSNFTGHRAKKKKKGEKTALKSGQGWILLA